MKLIVLLFGLSLVYGFMVPPLRWGRPDASITGQTSAAKRSEDEVGGDKGGRSHVHGKAKRKTPKHKKNGVISSHDSNSDIEKNNTQLVSGSSRNNAYSNLLTKVMKDEKDKDEQYYNEMVKNYPNEPRFAEIFPRKRNYPVEMYRDRPDFTTLKVNDPLFLDMMWPEQRGPEATAYAAHMQWKRSLTDSERLRWQKWAVYKRIMMDNMFDYAVEDYVFQSLLSGLKKRAGKEKRVGKTLEAALWDSIARGMELEEAEQVQAVVESLYSAINRANFDEIQTLYLPDDANVEMVLPNYPVARGFYNVDKLWRRVVKESKPFGSIKAEVKSVKVVGFLAVVHVIEHVQAGSALRKVTRRGQRLITSGGNHNGKPKRIITTLVLRKFNKQWRVQVHHATKFSKSTLAGDAVPDPTAKMSSNEVLEGSGILPSLPDDLRTMLRDGGGGVSVVSRINKDGNWERVQSIGVNDGVDYEEVGKQGRVVEFGGRHLSPTTTGSKSSGHDDVLDSNAIKGLLGMPTDGEDEGEDNEVRKQSVTKLTVRALRTLTSVGSLTKEQKEVLLSDIIDKVSNDESSPVEIAYELLVVKGDGRTIDQASWKKMGIVNESGLEEFADQCRIICDNILEKQGQDKDKPASAGEL